MMLGYLLARAGVEVVVLEKHADFLRDFRGDTIHPSTLEVMHELGLLDEFLKLPHQRVSKLVGRIGNTRVTPADFSRLPVHCQFIAFMPQWNFLDFLARRGRRFPGFRLLMRTEATSLIEESGRVTGLRASSRSNAGESAIELGCDLVVGADGRHSTVRNQAGLVVEDVGAPMDVLWFSLPRQPSDVEDTGGRFDPGIILVTINRGDNWQCGMVIAKGSIEVVHRAGLDAFRAKIGQLVPFLADRLQAIRSFDDVKLLTVGVDRLKVWHREGLICIGDAAHTMSPVGGVGINLAIQDAVAAANLLTAPLKARHVTSVDLASVQKRREWPARATQRAQVFIQNRVIARVLGADALEARASSSSRNAIRPPLLLRIVNRVPSLQRIGGRLIGMGVRPEHVQIASSE